ncbi:Chagasin family peptidase inhibitor I42 family protein [Cryptosporidium meleagridis]|uniref:Chagasin family peptidase inhibitor I42 family protein n=1 Tax=Cryptosporidium meleagridis TaxID=93969 RepID=A0A2P4Z3C4_9CRYT|nr:Chagasin family peptidase inhibitor I42 family protein [Cryptosporidium meleagridis]
MIDTSNASDVAFSDSSKTSSSVEKVKLVNLDLCNSKEATINVQDISSFDSVIYFINVNLGTEITVNIRGNPTTGYSQQMIIKPDNSIIKVADAEPSYVPDSHPDGMVGYGGNYIFKFLAVGPGSTVSTIEYARYFERPPKCVFKTEIQFKVTDLPCKEIIKE